MKKTFKVFTALVMSAVIALSVGSPLFSIKSHAEKFGTYENNAKTGSQHWYEEFTDGRKYGVRQFSDLASEYGASQDYTKPWIYYALEFYESVKDGETADFTDREGGQWKLTDHYVMPGDELLMVYYIKSNVGVYSTLNDIQVDRKVFDIVPDKYKGDLTYVYGKDWYKNGSSASSGNKGYIGVKAEDGLYGDGLYNTGYPANKVAGSENWPTGNTNPNHDATGPVAQGKGNAEVIFSTWPAFMQNLPYNHVSLTQYSPAVAFTDIFNWDIIRMNLWEVDEKHGIPMYSQDEYVVYNKIKVRTQSETYRGDTSKTVNYVPYGTVGHIGFEETMTTFYNSRFKLTFNKGKIGDPTVSSQSMQNANVAGTSGCTVNIPAMTYDDLHTEDTNHVFKIGATARFMDGGEITDLAKSAGLGEKITLPSPSEDLAPEGKKFGSWNDGTNDYNAGDKYTITKDVKFNANWVMAEHKHIGSVTTKNAKDPTCTEPGQTADTYCPICDETDDPEAPDGILEKGDPIPALGHDYPIEYDENGNEVETVSEVPGSRTPSTCTEAGSYKTGVICRRCGAVKEGTEKTFTVEKQPHTEKKLPTEILKEATCTEDGKKLDVTVCAVCGTELSRQETAIPKFDHKRENGDSAIKSESEILTQVTCDKAGTYRDVSYCAICGEDFTEDPDAVKLIPPLGHVATLEPTIENETVSSCSEAGTYDEVYYCQVCGIELNRETKTKAKDEHVAAPAIRENEKAATCTEAGEFDSVVKCSICGTELSRTHVDLEALGHKYDLKIKRPTCTANGSATYTCSRCGDSYTDKILALGHNFKDYVYNNDATEDKDGTETAKCTRCDVTDTRTKPYTATHNAGTGTDTDVHYAAFGAILVPDNQKVDYRTKVTLVATSSRTTEDYKIALFKGDEKIAEGTNLRLEAELGELKETATYKFAFIDESGNIVKDAEGNEVAKEVTIEVDRGIFKRIIAFFKWLFHKLEEVTFDPSNP
ncbi:MAG: hypothetical protein IKH65_05315 [Clostridia bacterium]|nr:hypothetical protein [Clostridia bacterium]